MATLVSPQPPGPKGLPIVGSLFEFRRDPMAFFVRTAAEYGDVVAYHMGPRRVYLMRHPDQIKDVLVTQQHSFMKGEGLQWAKRFLGEGLLTAEGEFHRRQRRLVQPAFHRQRIAGYGDVMVAFAARTRDRWRDGDEFDVAREMMALTLLIAGKTLFDVEMEDETDAIGRSLNDLLRLFDRFSLPFAGLINRLPLPSNVRFRRAKARLDGIVYGMITERRREGRDHGDLLSMLVMARDEEDGGVMDDGQIRDEAMTLLLAGHETTANALTWTFYLLSQNPDAEARLHDELDRVLGGRLPGFDDLPRLRYTEGVLAESMRLYPPAWILGRRALRDVTIAPYVVPRGAIVLVSPYITQRDPRFFPDPLAYRPERWTPEAPVDRPKFAYFPFGGGARQCVGESFAWMEGTLLLATLAQRFKLRLVPGHRVEPRPMLTLRPRHGVRMTVARRQ